MRPTSKNMINYGNEAGPPDLPSKWFGFKLDAHLIFITITPAGKVLIGRRKISGS